MGEREDVIALVRSVVGGDAEGKTVDVMLCLTTLLAEIDFLAERCAAIAQEMTAENQRLRAQLDAARELVSHSPHDTPAENWVFAADLHTVLNPGGA